MADEVTDMEVDKVADMKIPIEDRTEVILEIGDWVKMYTNMMAEFAINTSYLAAKFLTNKKWRHLVIKFSKKL